jgi:hypothetical protein
MLTFQDEILEDLERDFGQTVTVRRVSALSYNTDTGEKSETSADYEITQCLVRRLKKQLDYPQPGVPESMNSIAKRADLKVVIRLAKLLAAGTTTITESDRVIYLGVTYYIADIDDRLADTFVVYLRRAS